MLKPVDLHTIFPRSIDVQRVQQVQQHRPAVDQHILTKETIEAAQIRQEQVQQGEESATDNGIRNDEKRKKRQLRYRRFANGEESTVEEEQLKENDRGQHIDIKI